MSQQTTVTTKETVFTSKPQVASAADMLVTDEGSHHSVGKSHTKEIIAGAIGVAGAAIATKLYKHHKHRNSSSSSSSSDSASPAAKSSKKRRFNLSAAVGKYLLSQSLGTQLKGDTSIHEGEDEESHKARNLMLAAVAKRLATKKYRKHKEEKALAAGTHGTTETGPSVTEKIKSKLHRDSSVSSSEEEASHKNKALVKNVALTVLPLLKNQIRQQRLDKTSTGGGIALEGPLYNNPYIKAMADMTEKHIESVGPGPKHQAQALSADEGINKLALKDLASKASATLAARHLLRNKLHIRKQRPHPATYDLKQAYKPRQGAISSSSDSETEQGNVHFRGHNFAHNTGLSGPTLSPKQGHIQRQKPPPATYDLKPAFKPRMGVISSPSSSDVSDVEGGKLHQKPELAAIAASIAANLATKLNRRRERKTLKAQPVEGQNKSRLGQLRAISSSSSESSDEGEGVDKKKEALRAAAVAVATQLLKHRLEQRKSKLTESQYTSKLHNIESKLKSSEPVVSSDEELETGFRNAPWVVSGRKYVQRMVGKHYKKANPRQVHLKENETLEAHKKSKRQQAMKTAAVWALKHYAQKKVQAHGTHGAHGTSHTVSAGETHVSKADALKEKLHRHRYASSSESSSSSDEEETGKTRKAAATLAASRIALNATRKLKRRQERKNIKREVVAEKDQGKLAGLKTRLESLRARSSSSSSSSDEETHKKKKVFIAASTAAAAHLLKKRYDLKKSKYTEEVYTQKVGGIDNRVNKLDTSVEVSSDEEYAKQTGKRSILKRGAQMFNRYTRRNYKQQTGSITEIDNNAGGEEVTKLAHRYPRAWVKLTNGVSMSLLRESIRKRHQDQGQFQDLVITGTAIPNPNTTSNTTTTVTTTETTVPVVESTIVDTTTAPIVESTIGTTAGTTVGTARNYELVDANVKVKKHGLTHLTYENLGHFVTLRIEHDYLLSKGHIKPGDKVKALLGLRDDKVFSLDNCVDEQTRLQIKDALGLHPEDSIKLEYIGAHDETGLVATDETSTLGRGYSDYENNYISTAEARAHNVSKMDRILAKIAKHSKKHGHSGHHHHSKTGHGTTTTTVTTEVPAGGAINPTQPL